MKKTVFLMMSLCCAGLFSEVCLTIDDQSTGNKKHPNQAREVADHTKFFYVFDDEIACFDTSKEYYMQYFLFKRGRETWYGTKCRYVPKAGDEGKTLVYEGNNGSSICPVL